MLHSKLFKKYYPIKDISDLFHMPQKDRETLAKWLRMIQADVNANNYISTRNAEKCGSYKCTQIYFLYDKDILLLAEKICKISNTYSEIDEQDIDFVNDVIYRHKYNWLISCYCFPIRNKN